jgi:NitT/TauT family transport system permease protein
MKRQILGYGISTLILLVIWQLLSMLMDLILIPNQAHFLVSPVEAFSSFVNNWQDYAKHFWGTSYRLVIAMFLALIVAIPIGLYIGHKKSARAFWTPFIYTVYPIPKVVFWPVLFMLVGVSAGLEDLAKILFIWLVVFFQLLVSIRDTAANMHRAYIISALAAGLSPFDMYRHVLLPGALPEIFSSLRISLGFGLFAAYVAESSIRIGTPEYGGLGYFISVSYPFNTRGIYAGIVAIAILGLLLYLLLEILERWLCRWKRLEIEEPS